MGKQGASLGLLHSGRTGVLNHKANMAAKEVIPESDQICLRYGKNDAVTPQIVH